MKNVILSAIVMAFVMVSCNQKSKETESTKTETSSELYACPMHPEVTGKKGESCSKCGMELTEPVTQTQTTHEEKKTESTKTETSSELYACPMHPEVQGKKGEMCSKCGMELTEPVK